MMREVLFLLTALCLSCGSAQSNYTPSGSCESEHTCEYLYAVEQSRFTGNASDPITVTANVQITCESSGRYNSVAATRYCMTIEDVDGNFLTLAQDTGNDGSSAKQYLVQQYLAGWFCFVQTSDGEVVSVYHSREEEVEAANFKKSIAASFQANFMGTEEKIEVDPQSKHTSHYSYQQGEDGSTKMHRTVMTEDVVEYPMHVSPQDIQLVKEEDVEYSGGRLSKSNGTAHVSLSKKFTDNTPISSAPGDDPDIDMFTYDASYSIELRVCRLVPQATRRRRAIFRQSLASDSSSEENLMAIFNETKENMEMLNNIRKELGSAESILQKLRNLNENNTATINLLEKSMILEKKYGPPERQLPVADYVLDYLEELSEMDSEEAVSKRTMLYSLLTSESSQRSQEALIRHFNSTVNEREKNALIIAIAMVSHPTDQFIRELETLINLRADFTDPLLLAYGAVTANTAPDVQRQMVSFLTDRLPEAEADEAALVHLIHSLGNTQSELVIEHVVRFVDHKEEMVKVTAISALRFFTGLPSIQQTLLRILLNNATEAVVSAIIDALSDGFDHDRAMEIHDDVIVALMNVTLTLNSHDLAIELEDYFQMVGTEQTLQLVHSLEAQRSNVTDTDMSPSRYQRSSTNYWPSSNSYYNVIASQSSRAYDVSLYPHYRSFLWSSKVGKDNGTYQAYVQATAGIFGGINSDLNFKFFGKAVLRGHALGQTYEAVKIQGQFQRSGSYVYKMLYAKIAGTVLVDLSRWDSYSSSTQRYSLYNSRLTIFSFSYPIFIYVGSINLGVSFHMSLDGSVDLSLRPYGNGAQPQLSFIPGATATIEGSVSLSILAAVRVGASLEGSVPYEIWARQTAYLCLNTSSLSLQRRACTSVFHQWYGIRFRLYAWYQTRSVEWCDGWIDYPCGFTWSDRHTWDALTFDWSMGSSGGWSTLYNSCNGYASCETV